MMSQKSQSHYFARQQFGTVGLSLVLIFSIQLSFSVSFSETKPLLPVDDEPAKTVMEDYRDEDRDNMFQHQYWDIAVGHGANLSLITFDADYSTTIQEILVPFPKNSSASFLINVKSNSKKQNLGQISFIASDSTRNLLYYTHKITAPGATNLRLTDLNVFNFVTNESKRLLQSSNGNTTFNDIMFYNNSLYWIDSVASCIMQLRLNRDSTQNEWISEKIEVPTVLVNLVQASTFDGLAVDSNSGFIYWTVWGAKTSPSGFSIQYFDGHASQILVSKDISHPTGLIITPDSYLYWVNKPHGMPYSIERVKLTQNYKKTATDATATTGGVIAINRETIYVGQNQHVFALLVPCSNGNTLFVTDIKSESIFRINTTTQKQFLVKQYENTIPHGMIQQNHKRMNLCTVEEKNIATSAPVPASKESHHTISTTNGPSVISNISSTDTQSVPASAAAFTDVLNSKGSTINTGPTNNSRLVQFYSCDHLNHCGNGGSCFVLEENNVFCLCPAEWSGPTCEIIWPSNANLSLDDVSGAQDSMTVVLISMGIVIGCLVVIIGYLAVKVCQLDRKPKIHRRLIVARGGAENSNTVCELIDIENCCNMNICETPCYESGNLLGTNARRISTDSGNSGDDVSCDNLKFTKSHGRKLASPHQEDKERLLD